MPLRQARASPCKAFYLSHVLGSLRWGLGFAGLLGALFGALYGLLVSEGAALLMGSLLLFGLLTLVMVITRRLDWYALRPLDLEPPDLRPVEPVPGRGPA